MLTTLTGCWPGSSCWRFGPARSGLRLGNSLLMTGRRQQASVVSPDRMVSQPVAISTIGSPRQRMRSPIRAQAGYDRDGRVSVTQG